MAFSDGKQSRLLVPFLLLVICGLVVLNFYQNNVIQNQRDQIRGLLTDKMIGVAAPAKPAAAEPEAKPAAPSVTAKPAGKPGGQDTAKPQPKNR